MLLQQGPPVALTNSWYLGTALVGAAVAYLVPVDGRVSRLVFPYVDALALGIWAAVGHRRRCSPASAGCRRSC